MSSASYDGRHAKQVGRQSSKSNLHQSNDGDSLLRCRRYLNGARDDKRYSLAASSYRRIRAGRSSTR